MENNNNNNNNNIVNFEFFKGQKELDKDYPKFLGNAERTFNAKTTPESMMKRLYYTLRYLEGHINGMSILFLLTGQDMRSQQEGIGYIIDWLEGILKDLRCYYNGRKK